MALSLKDKETDRLVREVAALTGESLTDTIRRALVERLQREKLRRGSPTNMAARVRAIGEHCVSLPDYDTRSPNKIIGYDGTDLWT